MLNLKTLLKRKKPEVMTLAAYLEAAKSDPSLYAGPAERILKAIGEPRLLDTASEPRLNRLFGARTIRVYDTFKEFYGMEHVIENIVSFFRHAAQNLEESRQILYLLGPVGSAKSSLAEKLKSLMASEPIYVLTDAEGRISPVLESPLGLFDPSLSDQLSIPASRLSIKASPWAIKRLDEYDGDLTKFKVTKLYPEESRQLGISKTEPGDENNQDISVLVGKLDIRKLEHYAQNDPDAYSYTGGLCLSNQGLLEFVEMFKAPIKVLNPLLTATQEKNYKGTEAIGAIPFDGVVLAHSNESEWQQFATNKQNEAFLDRVYIVRVPYCLRMDEEVQIYKKLLAHSTLSGAPTAPHTLELLAKFCVFSRIDHADAEDKRDVEAKLRVYNGEDVKAKHPRAKSVSGYKETLSSAEPEGFDGVSTRAAYKILAKVYNFDPDEIAADPVHLFQILKEYCQTDERLRDGGEAVVVELLEQPYAKEVSKHIQTAFLDSYDEFGQSIFDRYVLLADHYIQKHEYRDHDSGQIMNLEALDEELKQIETRAGVHNPQDFRAEIVSFSLRYKANNKGKSLDWKSYEKARNVIEAIMFSKTEDMLPVISFSGQATREQSAKHKNFVENMKKLGYTEKQVRRVVDWHLRVKRG